MEPGKNFVAMSGTGKKKTRDDADGGEDMEGGRAEGTKKQYRGAKAASKLKEVGVRCGVLQTAVHGLKWVIASCSGEKLAVAVFFFFLSPLPCSTEKRSSARPSTVWQWSVCHRSANVFLALSLFFFSALVMR